MIQIKKEDLKNLFWYSVFLFFLSSNSFVFARDLSRREAIQDVMLDIYREEAMIYSFQDAEDKISGIPEEEAEKEVAPVVNREEIMQSSLKKTQDKASVGETLAFLKTRLHPYVSLETTYTDNLFLSETGIKGDVINVISPGLKFILGEQVPGKDNDRLELDMGVAANVFSYNPRLNRQQPYGRLSAQVGRGNNKFILDSSFRKDYAVNSSLTTGSSGLTNYTLNDTNVIWGYEKKRFGFDLGYNRTAYLYAGRYKASNSYTDQTYMLTGFFQYFPKTRLLVEYDYGRVDYTKTASTTNDNRYHRLWVGVKGNITKKTSGLVKYGYEARDYKGKKDKDGDTVKVELEHKYSRRTSLLFSVTRGLKEATTISDTFDEGLDSSLRLIYVFNRRLSMTSGFSYINDKYKSGRKDYTYSPLVYLQYNFQKWLKMRLGYKYQERDSNQVDNSYKNHVYSLETGVIF